ncbi:hypothetical protein MBM_09503 [Drepanopeziza brunnea f. sp. 'multigermtubi' MB_m1]|uniref:Uncharacterized protein n=1 Tax=Marssonina brunnea f. sp. multigermtubi (strain MB_m1) TaxID=1072389 RepID=K1WUM5_MARBU|nr:uncharacterized protein MBM_09503 [Drepanopeziza brunnea f. sp. 'multigermtubi' MB_m1]EKD12328.1 hypothetical protein MBM_09503 [Drepanopeziza brunnea f. sp. 'multigermtubi' MB_m1]
MVHEPLGMLRLISVPNLNNSKKGSSTFERTGKLLTSFKRLRINKKETKSIRIAKNAPKAILTMTDEKETKEISKEIEATGFGNGPLKDFGFGNKPFKDLKRKRTIGNYIGNPLPIRPLAKHNTLAYSILNALNDNKDDFLKLKATDLHLKAKELALFARSFLKKLKYSRLDDDFKT